MEKLYRASNWLLAQGGEVLRRCDLEVRFDVKDLPLPSSLPPLLSSPPPPPARQFK